MARYPYADAVVNGVTYLNENYPDWLSSTSELNLNMDDHLGHILYRVTGKLPYETREVLEHDANWQQAHGFLPNLTVGNVRELTREWQYHVRHAREVLEYLEDYAQERRDAMGGS